MTSQAARLPLQVQDDMEIGWQRATPYNESAHREKVRQKSLLTP
jgi:hypothetical protein